MNNPAAVSPFFPTDWKPADYRQVKHDHHRAELYSKGYFICENFFSASTIQKLNDLYREHRHEGMNHIGMFVSAYSKDLDYRKAIHEAIGDITEPELDNVFTSYQPAVYNYVIKSSRPEHELPIHQDLALIDENKSSPLNIWIPLMDITMENGPVCVVPQTQYFFPPYRSNFSEQNVIGLSDELKQYAVPLCLKASDLLVFDSRLIHYSMPNKSGKDRVAAITYIFPENISFLFMSKSNNGSPFDFDLMELKREDFFINTDFEKAEESGLSGAKVGNIAIQPFTVSAQQLHEYFHTAGINRNTTQQEHNPPVKKISILKKILQFFIRRKSR